MNLSHPLPQHPGKWPSSHFYNKICRLTMLHPKYFFSVLSNCPILAKFTCANAGDREDGRRAVWRQEGAGLGEGGMGGGSVLGGGGDGRDLLYTRLYQVIVWPWYFHPQLLCAGVWSLHFLVFWLLYPLTYRATPPSNLFCSYSGMAILHCTRFPLYPLALHSPWEPSIPVPPSWLKGFWYLHINTYT